MPRPQPIPRSLAKKRKPSAADGLPEGMEGLSDSERELLSRMVGKKAPEPERETVPKADHDREVASLNERIAKLDSKIEEIQKDKAKVVEERDSAKRSLETARARLEELEGRLESKSSDLRAANDRVSKLETKDVQVEMTKFQIYPLLEDILSSVTPMANEYGVKVITECKPLTVKANVQQLQELISNLLVNGIKYNKPDGMVRLPGNSGVFEQLQGLFAVGFRVAGAEPSMPLESRQYHLEQRDRECAVEIRDLGHVSDQPLAPAKELRGIPYLTRVGHGSENRLNEGGLSASVRAYYPQEVALSDLEVDMLEGLVSVVCDADVAKGHEVHWRMTI